MKDVSWFDLSKFVSKLPDNLSTVEQAVAILWFRFCCKDVDRKGLGPLGLEDFMDFLHLRNRQEVLPEVNSLAQRSSFIVMDSRQGGFAVNYQRRATLDSTYGPLLDLPPEIEVSKDLISPVGIDKSGSFVPVFQELVRQANI